MQHEASLADILQAREARALEQDRLRRALGAPVVCFTMNIPGPVKDSPLIRRGFRAGQAQLLAGLRAAGLEVLSAQERLAHTGCEGLYAVAGPAQALKGLCVCLEEASPLGRLFDLDVLPPGGDKLGREGLGRPPRGCIVCGAPGRDCAARRAHTVGQLQGAVRRILEEHFAAADREAVSALVTRALLDEVCVTPKPGLVDRANNGSHRDMDIFTFTASAAALAPYWGQCFQIGRETAHLPPEGAFRALRRAGQGAERAMFAATGGVNTHKGAIFTLGLICGAVGRTWTAGEPCREPEEILRVCSQLAAGTIRRELDALGEETARTAGQRLYLSQGMEGVRGEASRGYPSVGQVALPALKDALEAGRSLNDAGVAALLRLIAAVDDTNLAARGGREGARRAAARCAQLLEGSPLPQPEEAAPLDQEFIRQNLSPGGCADLLSAALFLLYWQGEDSAPILPAGGNPLGL